MSEPLRGAREDLCAELTRLRAVAGGPALERISMRANQVLAAGVPKMNRQRVHDWIAGKSVPQRVEHLVALAAALEGMAEARLKREGRLVSELRAPSMQWWRETRNAAVEEARATAPIPPRDGTEESVDVPDEDETTAATVSPHGRPFNVEDHPSSSVIAAEGGAGGRFRKKSTGEAGPKNRKTFAVAGILATVLVIGSGMTVAFSWQRQADDSTALQENTDQAQITPKTDNPPDSATSLPVAPSASTPNDEPANGEAPAGDVPPPTQLDGEPASGNVGPDVPPPDVPPPAPQVKEPGSDCSDNDLVKKSAILRAEADRQHTQAVATAEKVFAEETTTSIQLWRRGEKQWKGSTDQTERKAGHALVEQSRRMRDAAITRRDSAVRGANNRRDLSHAEALTLLQQGQDQCRRGA